MWFTSPCLPSSPLLKYIFINPYFLFSPHKVTTWYYSSWMCLQLEEDLYSTNSAGKAGLALATATQEEQNLRCEAGLTPLRVSHAHGFAHLW